MKRQTLFLTSAVMLITLGTAANAQSPTERTQNMLEITKTAEANSFAELEAVKKALQPYINAAKTGDGKLSRTAFFDHANIVGTVGGEFSAPDADAFSENVASIGESPDVQHQISWIDISGPAAAAKVEFINWAGFRFTDFFVLYKKDGEWKISGKVYDSHSNN